MGPVGDFFETSLARYSTEKKTPPGEPHEVCAAPPVKTIVPSAIQLVRRITDITLVVEINGDAIMQRIFFEMNLGKIAHEALLVISPLGFC